MGAKLCEKDGDYEGFVEASAHAVTIAEVGHGEFSAQAAKVWMALGKARSTRAAEEDPPLAELAYKAAHQMFVLHNDVGRAAKAKAAIKAVQKARRGPSVRMEESIDLDASWMM